MTPTPTPVECWRCGADTGEDPADVGENVTYCRPCRAVMVLPCDCGGRYGAQYNTWLAGDLVRACPDCGAICAYWDDDDLVDPETVEAGR